MLRGCAARCHTTRFSRSFVNNEAVKALIGVLFTAGEVVRCCDIVTVRGPTIPCRLGICTHVLRRAGPADAAPGDAVALLRCGRRHKQG